MSGNPDNSSALFTDLYQLTMAQAYWKSGNTAEATFSLFIRNYPPDRGYLVAAGVEDALDYLENLRFSREDIDYLRSIGSFQPEFLDFLAGVRFTGGEHPFPCGQGGEAAINDVDGVVETVEEMSEKVPGEGGLFEKVFLVVASVTQTGPDVNARTGVVGFRVRRIPHEAPVYKTTNKAGALVWVIGLPQNDRRYLGP